MAEKDDIVFDSKNQDKIKVCSKCKKELSATKEFFHSSKGGRYGLKGQCKDCVRLYDKKYKKKYKEINKNKIKKYDRKYYQANKDKIKVYNKKYREINKNKIEKYQETNKDQIKARNKKYQARYSKSLALYNAYYNNENLILVEKTRCDPNNNELLQVKCAYCGRWINPTNIQVSNRLTAIIRINKGEHRFYCNDNNNYCRLSCPIYKQRKYPKGFRKGTSREVAPELRQMCFERDSWECQKCGASIQDATLHCHHIKGYTQNKILANDIDNVITLCKECHKEIHSQEGCKYHELQCHNE